MAASRMQNAKSVMSNNGALGTALDALLELPNARTKMGQFRDVAPTVERLVQAGVKRPAILKTLADHGLELTPAQLKSYLGRWRTERKAAVAPSSPLPAQDQKHPPDTAQAQSVHHPAVAPPLPPNTPPPPPHSGRSIREIRNAEVDFAAAERWYREQKKAGKG